MATNIKHEAVFPPAIFSLKKMTHPSPSRNGAKGAYMLYDPQQNADDLFSEKRVNGVGGSAPGSPGSVQDYEQAVLKLQQEIEESNRKGSELEQIIADISSPNMSQSARVDSQGLEESSSGDSVGENVKDAHIRHLQRQVTVLQASLYKCEGWANRVSAALKERDKALDEVARVTNERTSLQEENQQLQNRIETLGATLQDTQQNLQQVTQELQKQMYHGQLVSQLQEQVYRQKCEIATLKDSLSRLNQEHKSLKDSGIEVNSQVLGNVACSQELEHLHLVVDKLKDTVLEQRSYLLHLKKPNIRNTKSHSTSSSTGGLLDLGSTERKLSSPTLRSVGLTSAGSDIVAGNLSNQAGFGQSDWMTGLKAAGMKDSFLEAKQPLCRNVSSPDFGQQMLEGSRRKLSNRDVLDDVFNVDRTSPAFFHKDGNAGSDLQSQDTPLMAGSSSTVPVMKHKFSEFLRQPGNGDVLERTSNVTPAGGATSSSSSQFRATQSERLAQKQKIINNNVTKSEIIGRQPWRQAPGNNTQAQSCTPGSGVIDTFSQVSPGLTQGHKNILSKSVHQDYLLPTDSSRPFLFNGNTAQNRYHQDDIVEYENVNRNSPTFQPQRIYLPPPSSQEATVHMIDHNAMFGGKVTAAPPAVHNALPQGPNQAVHYINTSTAQGSGTTVQLLSRSEPISYRSRLSSDKLCPVCSIDYNQLSMEEFQTHVFECIDDQNQPETMKPEVVPDKLCPMCNARFGPETTQGLYEKHVHSHFGEESFEEPFLATPS
ncbi:unnamed protein product [Candidula unifasciata]|uniref:UBZ1-type domain-containing protein n=1 Tax=Candidula unifasciata TaxID=100452 RepID=A0A8S3YJR4_9EUPU|nr:unnamed protein product [Candidula unifasciata]